MTSLIGIVPNADIILGIDNIQNLNRVLGSDPMSHNNSQLRNSSLVPKGPARPTQQGVSRPTQDVVQRTPQQLLFSPPGLEQGQAQPGAPLQQGEPSSSWEPVPEELISKAALEYLGFTPRAATKMWSAWENWPSGVIRRESDPDDGRACVTFYWFILRHIIHTRDTVEQDTLEWERCLEGYGLCKGAQDYIQDYADGFRHLDQRSCSQWTMVILGFQYSNLEALQRRIRSNRALADSDPTDHPIRSSGSEDRRSRGAGLPPVIPRYPWDS